MTIFTRVIPDDHWVDEVMATMNPCTGKPVVGRLVRFVSREQVSDEPGQEYHGRIIGLQPYTANGGMMLVVVKLFEQTDFIRLMETL